MNTTEKLLELRRLQDRTDAIRDELQINPPGRVTYLGPLDEMSDQSVVVEADGFGGAKVSIIEGNYPVDYIIKFERAFPNESEAEGVADDLACQRASPDQILAGTD